MNFSNGPPHMLLHYIHFILDYQLEYLLVVNYALARHSHTQLPSYWCLYGMKNIGS